jgi:hypothetical protein
MTGFDLPVFCHSREGGNPVFLWLLTCRLRWGAGGCQSIDCKIPLLSCFQNRLTLTPVCEGGNTGSNIYVNKKLLVHLNFFLDSRLRGNDSVDWIECIEGWIDPLDAEKPNAQ